MTAISKNLDQPDQARRFERGAIHFVDLPGMTMGRAVFEPGWRWSVDVAPVVGTERCQATHYAVVVSGSLHVEMGDGTGLDLVAGDAHVVGPGHDAWVVGDEPCVTIDFIPPG